LTGKAFKSLKRNLKEKPWHHSAVDNSIFERPKKPKNKPTKISSRSQPKKSKIGSSKKNQNRSTPPQKKPKKVE
jgi:hypothetical protein